MFLWLAAAISKVSINMLQQHETKKNKHEWTHLCLIINYDVLFFLWDENQNKQKDKNTTNKTANIDPETRKSTEEIQVEKNVIHSGEKERPGSISKKMRIFVK